MEAFAQLVRRHLDERGWNLKTLAGELAPKNPVVALRKLRELFSGECVRDGVINSVCACLAIDPVKRQVALADDALARRRRLEEYQSARFTPHLWIEVMDDWLPGLVTVIGVDFFRRVEVNDVLASATDDEKILRLASSMVVEHFNSDELRVPRDHVGQYLYRRRFDLGYRFTCEGGFIEKVTGPYLAPLTYAWIA